MRVKVTPNAAAFSAKFEEGVLRVRVPAKAVDGKANQALLKELKKRGVKARIVSGSRSREKEIETECPLEELEERLR